MKIDTKTIAFNAIIAAVYAALTILLAPISYGSIQMRISEIMVFLAFYNKKYIPGLVLGCLIANIPSPLGLWDICFGTFATLVAVIAINKLPNRYLGALAGANMFVNYGLNAGYVFIGELVILVIGAFVFGILEKNKQVENLLEA